MSMKHVPHAAYLALGILAACTPTDAPSPTAQTAATSPTVTSPATTSPAAVPDAEAAARIAAAGNVLFWTDQERAARFRDMEAIYPVITATADTAPRALPAGDPLAIDETELADFMTAQNVAGLMVVKDGRVLLERYGLGMDADDRWTSFSVAKSFTSTLAGAAITDGHIASLDDPVTRYIPDLAGSAYDDVSVEQLLTMTSGVRWNEDYTDPDSDVAKMLSVPVPAGEDPVVAYMMTLPREAEPGTKWVYKTGETNLVGTLVTRATGRSLADYAEEKIVRPAGFAGDLHWMVDTAGNNIGGCCLSLRLADYARFGQWVLEGGADLPADWFARAGASQADIRRAPGYGYGYQWWTYPGEAFGAQGIFGQAVAIYPEDDMVVAMVANWSRATGGGLREAQLAFFGRLRDAAE
ncbi:MAG: serine hydrolase domain-containing protein [Pseudomonadota bacterium]